MSHGGGSMEAPAAPNSADAVNSWVQNMPQVYQTQMQYAPLQAQQQVDLATQYAGQYGQALKTANDALNPEIARLTPALANQAYEGMQSGVPDWMKAQYQSNMNAQLGSNAASPIGADYMSRGLLQQQQDWKQYYQNMGMSLSGRQPIQQAQTPQTTDYTSQYTPNSVGQQQQQGYGSWANLTGSMYNTNFSPGGVNLGILGRWGNA